MVRSLSRLLATLAMVLLLASCIFVLSVFPPTLSQVVARADLSGTIPAGAGSRYKVYIVTPTGGEFVLLMRENSGIDPVVVVLDSNLNLIQTYTQTQLNGWGSFDSSGTMLMADAAGNVEISNFAFSASELATVNVNPSWTSNPTLADPGFCSPYWQKNDIHFQVTGGNNLSYDQWQWWASQDFTSGAIPVNGTGGNYRVEAAYNVDDSPSLGEVVLVLSEQNNSSNVTFVAIPLVNIRNNTVLSPLLSNYPSKALTNIDSSSIGFAGDSLVAYSYDSHSLKRYSLTSPFNEIGSLPLGKSSDHLHYAYKMTGGYSVIYDEETRKLTKVANWW